MLDYKDILNKYYVIRLSAREISRQTGMSKSGVLKFIHAFEKCDELDFPLPPGITNAGIAMKVYGKVPGEGGRDESYEYPDYPKVLNLMNERKNMTLQVCWDRYVKRCMAEEKKPYQYRQFCELFGKARFMCGYRMEQFAFFRLMRLAQNIIAYSSSSLHKEICVICVASVLLFFGFITSLDHANLYRTQSVLKMYSRLQTASQLVSPICTH